MLLQSHQLFERHETAILADVARRFSFKTDSLRRLGSFESVVYECEKGGGEYILKLTHSLHRMENEVLAELDWTTYLAEGGLPVPQPLLSQDGRMVEVIEVEDSYFLTYAFTKAPGSRPTKDTWNETLFQSWGELIGRMHALTKRFEPHSPERTRFSWHEDRTTAMRHDLPPEEAAVAEKFSEHIRRLRSWDTGSDCYGLIHGDLHQGNFFVDDSTIYPFDFDDCNYHWYASDVAIPLFYALRDGALGEDSPAFARRFFDAFLEGYSRKMTLDRTWLARIPEFLKLRELDLYTIIIVEDIGTTNEWCRRFMEGRRQRILYDVPVVEMEFG